MDMCVERACIALLLGNTDKALQALGLAADERHKGGSNPTQQAAQQYVLVSACVHASPCSCRPPCWQVSTTVSHILCKLCHS